MSSRSKLFICLAFIWFGWQLHAVAQVRLTARHSVSTWDQKGALIFEIDSSYQKGPYFVRLDGPDGMIDSITAFNDHSRTYERMDPGEYCILVKCCATCTAEVCVEVKSYEMLLVDDVSVLWTKEQALPEIDSSAILLACTEMETEEENLCQVVFSLYTGIKMSPDRVQLMVERAVHQIKQFNKEPYPSYEEYNYDAWARISDPFEILFRFDETGQIMWVYSER